jgi:hypothetical protein
MIDGWAVISLQFAVGRLNAGRAKISARGWCSNQIICIRAGFEPRRGGEIPIVRKLYTVSCVRIIEQAIRGSGSNPARSTERKATPSARRDFRPTDRWVALTANRQPQTANR